MRKLRLTTALTALVVACSLAFAPHAVAQQVRAPSPPQKVKAEEAKYDDARQTQLMQQQAAALRPQTAGVTDIYAIGLAGWATQDVFLNELTGALAAAGKVLPVTGTIRLVNSRGTFKTLPLASRRNFAAAVRAVAGVMDKNEDVLLLFMTTHGDRRGIALQLPSVTVLFSPQEVAAVLNKEGITHRVVIVSACYAGIFVKPLANDNTIVLTAADDKNTSFGCADGRDWTYFGDALFNQSLKPGGDLRSAYDNARGLIAAWEKRDRFKPSNPQGSFGEAMTRRLAPLFEAAGKQTIIEQQ